MPYHVRRKDREITDGAVVDEILAAGKYATIALAGDEPYLVTLSYGYDAESSRLCFYAATAGHKLDLIAADPRACATVVDDGGYNAGECEHFYRSVVMRGRMRVVTQPDEVRAAMRVLIGHLEAQPDVEKIWERTHLDTEKRLGTFHALVFEIESVTAKQGK